jgi:hypothetical protein
MDNKVFKSIFNKVASTNGFAYRHSAWFKETGDCIIVLSLQKSNYSHLYYLNIKTFIKGVFGRNYFISKELVKDIGDIFRREPKEFESALNLQSELSILEREKEIDRMFEGFINPYTNVMLTKDEIIKQYHEGSKDFYLLPAIREELGVA